MIMSSISYRIFYITEQLYMPFISQEEFRICNRNIYYVQQKLKIQRETKRERERERERERKRT